MANNYSSDQLNVFEDFKRFLFSDKNYMVVSGAAGTGKTTLIETLQSISLNNNWNCIPLGVWGRSSSSITQISGIPSITILKYNRVFQDIENKVIDEKSFSEWYENFYKRRFSFIDTYVKPGLRLILNIIKKALELFLNKRREFITKTVLIVDEASTLVLNDLLLAFDNTKTVSKNVKVLLLGDDCQLPPAKKSDSGANVLFDLNWIEDNTIFKTFENIKMLKTSHRVSEGPLFELAGKLRTLASTNSSGIEARKLILDSLNNQEVIGLGKQACYTNLKNIDNLTEKIFIGSETELRDVRDKLRNVYLNKPSDILVNGDFLRSRINGKKEAYVTGDEFIVKEIIDDTLEDFIIVRAEVVSRIKEFTGNLFRDSYNFFSNLFRYNKGINTKIAIYLPPLIDDDEYLKGTNIIRNEVFNAWERLEKEPDVHDVVAVSYGYAVTIQHAQGGEWDTVALSLAVEPKYDTARYWYTIITRAKKQIFIVQ